ncbi:hypothetical protein F5884DRAFT_345833 [Xylogone sp. PMI_703]|nr:hypothetical protein F5884DRAFT_345833 [Xylogone sp. PMI_703]
MAKRTRDSKYRTHDAVLGLKRQFLACTQDIKDIHYQYDDCVEAVSETPGETSASPVPEIREESKVPALMPVVSISAPVQTIEDVPVAALDIVRAIVAYKLKKPITQIPSEKSLKDISAGM